jgi:hypothetical protein
MLQDKLGSRILGRSSELRFHSKRTFTGVPSGACNKLACGKPLGGQNDLFRWQSGIYCSESSKYDGPRDDDSSDRSNVTATSEQTPLSCVPPQGFSLLFRIFHGSYPAGGLYLEDLLNSYIADMMRTVDELDGQKSLEGGWAAGWPDFCGSIYLAGMGVVDSMAGSFRRLDFFYVSGAGKARSNLSPAGTCTVPEPNMSMVMSCGPDTNWERRSLTCHSTPQPEAQPNNTTY